MELLLTILSIILTAFILPALRAWAQSNKQTAISILIASVQNAMECAARNRIERDIPRLAKRIIEDPTLDSGVIRDELYKMGEETLNEIIDYYKVQGNDLTKMLGEPLLKELLRASVDYMSPFAGQVTSEILVKPGIAKAIIDDGLAQEKLTIGMTDEDEDDNTNPFTFD